MLGAVLVSLLLLTGCSTVPGGPVQQSTQHQELPPQQNDTRQ
jgi:outer membrane murein-binding lipoprotein Lpp